MILRKPYAFFIKNFKLLHLVLSLLMLYLIYRTGFLITFFNEYISSNRLSTNMNLTNQLFNIYMFVFPFIIIIMTIVILSVLAFKKKPYRFYILNIIIYIALIVVYNNTYLTVGKLETTILDLRNLRLIRDILLISVLFQVTTIIRTVIYATGFDIKKFNFGEDLAQLDIGEEDNEEFEFELNIDVDKAHRDIRRRYRFTRYVYLENKFLINIITLILISTVCFVIYFNINIYNKEFKQGDVFATSNFIFSVKNTYVTQRDYKNEKISDNFGYIIIEIDLKNNYYKPMKMEIARTELHIGNNIFYHNNNYRDRLFDVGISYENQKIGNEFERYILVYKVPTELLNEKMYFKYVDNISYFRGEMGPSRINVRLKAKNIDKIVSDKLLNINEENLINETLFGNSKINISSFNIKEEHKINYKFCAKSDVCFDSNEYLRPSYMNNDNMVLLHLNGQILWDNDVKHLKYENMFLFFKNFATINYKLNGVNKVFRIQREVSSTRVVRIKDYYIEVPAEVMQAEEIYLMLNVRNTRDKYILK